MSMHSPRRLGELIAAQWKSEGKNKGGGNGSNQFATGSQSERVANTSPPTLAEAGIDKKLSSRAQKIAAIADEYDAVQEPKATVNCMSSDEI